MHYNFAVAAPGMPSAVNALLPHSSYINDAVPGLR